MIPSATDYTTADHVRDRGAAVGRHVGKIGALDLEYVKRGGETVLAKSRCSSPWHLLPPMGLDDCGGAYTLLLNPSGGLVGGDHLSVRARLGRGTHVLLSSLSANRVYRSASEPSRQVVEITLEPDATLEWCPDLTIPFAGSRFHQTIRVTLGSGATVVLWDGLAAGRIARGERWAYASLENEISIRSPVGAVLERYSLPSAQEEAGRRAKAGPAPALATDWNYVASLFVINDRTEAEVWKRLEHSLGGILDGEGGGILGGVSEPPAPGLVVKLVARTAVDLHNAFERLWEAVRRELWGLPAPALRRY